MFSIFVLKSHTATLAERIPKRHRDQCTCRHNLSRLRVGGYDRASRIVLPAQQVVNTGKASAPHQALVHQQALSAQQTLVDQEA